MTIFHDKLLTKTYRDEGADYAVPNVLSSRDLVFRPDFQTKTLHAHSLLSSLVLDYRFAVQSSNTLYCIRTCYIVTRH